MRTRQEHIAWCQTRALEYLDAGDIVNAVASMGSDLNKHDETRALSSLILVGMMDVARNDHAAVRRWIMGFNP